jgi:hypothetical protein
MASLRDLGMSAITLMASSGESSSFLILLKSCKNCVLSYKSVRINTKFKLRIMQALKNE